jgi:hypothetical protein
MKLHPSLRTLATRPEHDRRDALDLEAVSMNHR